MQKKKIGFVVKQFFLLKSMRTSQIHLLLPMDPVFECAPTSNGIHCVKTVSYGLNSSSTLLNL